MYRKRIIVCLTISNGQLVKTVKFDNPRYIGDPMNTVRIFDRKQVDELMLLDITATKERCEINYGLVEKIAEETMFPFAYGGGIRSHSQAARLFRIGIEKIVLCSAVTWDMSIISMIAGIYGSQSVVVCVDVMKAIDGSYYVRNRAFVTPEQFAAEAVGYGAGEIIVHSVDRDGGMQGYDFDLVRRVVGTVDVPVVALGGASSYANVESLLWATDVSAAAASSLFIFQGKNKGVLINYPSVEERLAMKYCAVAEVS